jgi:hypothetical protein
MLDRKLTDNAPRGYIAALLDLKPSQVIQAFSRALDDSKFFPPPATLRELSGQTMTGDGVASEAREELFRIVGAMRGAHGPKLQPILGKVKYGTEVEPRKADGNWTTAYEAERHPATPFPLSRRTEAALVRLGWG